MGREKEILESQPEMKIWGESLKDIQNIKSYKGKFVITKSGKFFAELFPKSEWDGSAFFHDMILEELGIEDAQSPEIKTLISGGGKIEVELMEDYAECRLYGGSSVYGHYKKEDINLMRLAEAIKEIFHLDIPIQVIPEYDK